MSDSPNEGLVTKIVNLDSRWQLFPFYFGLFVWVTYLVGTAWSWGWRDKLLGLIIGIPTLFLITIKMGELLRPAIYDTVVDSLTPSPKADDRADDELKQSYEEAVKSRGRSEQAQLVYALRMVAWVTVLPVLMFLVGNMNGIVLFMFGFGLRFFNDIRSTVVITVLFSLGIYLFFFLLMGMRIQTGFFDIPSLVRILASLV